MSNYIKIPYIFGTVATVRKSQMENSKGYLESAGFLFLFFYRAVSLFCTLAALGPPLSLAPVNHLERAFSASCKLTFDVK